MDAQRWSETVELSRNGDDYFLSLVLGYACLASACFHVKSRRQGILVFQNCCLVSWPFRIQATF